MSGTGDDNDNDLKPDGRAGLEAGTGLEIEQDDAPERDIGLGSEDETPSWLKGVKRAEVAHWSATADDGELAPETDQLPDGKTSSWVEIDAELWTAEDDDDDDSGERIQTEGTTEEEESSGDVRRKPVVVHESQKTRRILIAIAAAAACVCGISTYMFLNDLGPFAPAAPAIPPAEEQPLTDGDIEAVGWATAGEGYSDLYALIFEQTRGAAGTDEGAGQGDLILMEDYDVFSGTNEQVEGVLEADVIKAEGGYIYSINSNNLLIVRADGGDMELVSKIAQPSEDEMQVYFEMFVAGNRLIAVRQGLNKSALQNMPGMEDTDVPTASIWYPFGGQIVDTSIDIFDISDRSTPVKLHTLSQSGTYVSSRVVGDYLYLITTYYGDVPKMKVTDPRTFVPLYARDGEQLMPGEKDILIPPGSQWPCYTVISGIDAMNEGDFVSLKSVYGDVGTIYASTGAVYLARMTFEETKEPAGTLPPAEGTDGPGLDYVQYTNWSETLLTKLTIGSGRIEPRAQAKVPGYVLDQFSLDEYDGALRFVTTVDHNVWYGFNNSSSSYTSEDWARLPVGSMETSNALYTLDEDLGQLGRIDDIAPGERVNASRFLKNVAYFTTYNKIDPLFSVDLSDPAAPRVANTLQLHWLPGYLLPYSDGRLLGLGRELDRGTGIRLELTLMMFENSIPADLWEMHSLVVEDDNADPGEQNPKAVLVNEDKALVAFPVNGKYLVFGYDDMVGFEKIAEIEFDSGEDIKWPEIRGLIIGDTFYMVSPNVISAFAVDEGFGKVGSLRADERAGPVNRWNIGGPAGITPHKDTLPDGVVLDDNV